MSTLVMMHGTCHLDSESAVPVLEAGEDIKFIEFKRENQFLDLTESGKFCMVYESLWCLRQCLRSHSQFCL
jgi:hypothetical protein